MAKGVTIDLIVDPKGAIDGIGKASDESNKFTGILGNLGKIGVSAVAAVGTAAIAAAGALTAATVSAGKYADEILQASTNTNLSTDSLQAYKYAAEQMDVSFETFVSSQGKFTKSMQSATAGTGPAAEAFASLGLSVTDSSGNLVDSEQLYWQAIDALGGLTNETERTALAQQIFGRGGAEMNSIIAKGSAGFAELSAQAQANGAIMSGTQLEALGAFDDKMEALTSTVTAAKNALGLTLLPVLDELAGSGTSALGQFTTALLDADGDMSKAGPAFETLGTNVASALVSAVPKILQVGTSLVSGLIQGIVAQAPSLIQTAIPLVVSFATAILGMLPALLDAGLKILIALVQGIAAALPTLIPAAVDAIIGLVGALIDNLPLLIEAGIQLVIGLALGLIAALPQLIEKIPDLVVGIITALVAAIPQLAVAGVQLLVGLIQNLPEIIAAVISAAPKIVDGLVKAFTDPAFLAELGKAGVALMQGFIDGITSMIGAVGNAVGGVMDFVAGFFPHSPAEHGPFSGSGWTQLGQSGLAIADQFNRGLTSGFASPNLTSIMSDLSGGLSVDVRARASAGTMYADNAPAATGQGTVPPVNMPIYMLPEQDPRIVGRQLGREFQRTMAGVA